LDADDIIGAHYLEKAIQEFTKAPSTKLVYSNAELFGIETGEWLFPDFDYETLLFENIIFSSAIFKKKDYENTAGYDDNLIRGLEDWDFWLTLLNDIDIVYKIPEVCFYYRIKYQSRQRDLTEQIGQDLRKKIYNKHKEKYLKYIHNLIWMNPQLKTQQNYILSLEKEIKRIQLSKAYRLGKFVLRPFSYLRIKINK